MADIAATSVTDASLLVKMQGTVISPFRDV